MATATAAPTAAVSGTSSIGDAFLNVFKDPKVQTSIGGAIGAAVNSGLGALGLPGVGAETPEQKKAREDAERLRKEGEQRTMLIIGGGVAAVVVVLVIVFIRSGGK